MSRQRRGRVAFVALIALSGLGVSSASAQGYPVSFEYTQTVDLILNETDLNSGGWYHEIDWIDASGDGETVVFWTVAEKTDEPSQRHMFVVNWDGTGLREITPAGSDEAMTYPRFPRLNYDGSRMFFNANNYNDMFYISTATGALVHVCDTPGGTDFRKPFQINRDGTGMYFHWDNPVDSDCDTVGVYYSSLLDGLVRARRAYFKRCLCVHPVISSAKPQSFRFYYAYMVRSKALAQGTGIERVHALVGHSRHPLVPVVKSFHSFREVFLNLILLSKESNLDLVHYFPENAVYLGMYDSAEMGYFESFFLRIL